MNNVEIFLNKYKELESIASNKYDCQIYGLINNPYFKHIKDKLNYIREVRNLLSHKPLINNSYGIVPSDDIIETLNTIIKIVDNPPKAITICTKIENITFIKENDLVYDALKKMYQNGHFNIPVLQNNKVIGIFKEYSLIKSFIDGVKITKDLKFEKEFIDKYCSLNSKPHEKYQFVSKDKTLQEIQNIFMNNYSKNIRIPMIFVTENGNFNEKILGVITPYDAMDLDKYE